MLTINVQLLKQKKKEKVDQNHVNTDQPPLKRFGGKYLTLSDTEVLKKQMCWMHSVIDRTKMDELDQENDVKDRWMMVTDKRMFLYSNTVRFCDNQDDLGYDYYDLTFNPINLEQLKISPGLNVTNLDNIVITQLCNNIVRYDRLGSRDPEKKEEKYLRFVDHEQAALFVNLVNSIKQSKEYEVQRKSLKHMCQSGNKLNDHHTGEQIRAVVDELENVYYNTQN